MTATARDVSYSPIRCNRGILLGATIRTVRFDAPQKVTVEDGQP